MAKFNLDEKKSLAKSLYQSNDLAGAKLQYKEICDHKPDIDSLYMLGIIYGMTSDFVRSEQLLKKSLKLAPSNDVILNNIAVAQLKQGKHGEAIKNLKKSLSLNPKNTSSLNALGNAYREQGDVRKAENCYSKSLELRPDDAITNNNLGTVFLERCAYPKAIEYYKKALHINPNYYDANYNLGSAYQSIGNHNQAVEYYTRAKNINPSNSRAISAIANSQEKQGLNNEALATLQSLQTGIDITPDIACMYGRVYLNLGELDKGIEVIDRTLIDGKPGHIEEQELRFCLGELHDKKNNYDEAFQQFAAANKLRPYKYERSKTEEYFSSIMETYNSSTYDILTKSHNTSNSPIFIIGMPRSATSLVEQILSSHTEVYGGGELSYIGDSISKAAIDRKDMKLYPDGMNKIEEKTLDLMANDYLKLSRKDADDTARVTDKMPHNFIYVGYLFQLFPECRIIHCERDPIDVCLSIYFHNFNSNHPYSDNLSNLAHYYSQYHKLMQHWRNTYGDRIINVNYESLLNKPEDTAREIFDYLKLEWQDSCLKYYKNKRDVNTPSYAQVRKPLYKSSVKRWKNYEKHIENLINSLSDCI